jgi:hypothetical protein
MKILIKHRSEAQASKLLEQEREEEFFHRFMEFDEPKDLQDDDELTSLSEDLSHLHSIEEADEYFDWISGQYAPVEE